MFVFLFSVCSLSVILVAPFSISAPLVPLGPVYFPSALLTKFFPENMFRTSALECLTEIAGLVDLDPRYNHLFQQMFVMLVKQVEYKLSSAR